MPFIGTQPDVGGYSVLDALTASATASYTLQKGSANFSPSSANQLLVSLNGVIQKPGSSFTVSGSTLTFSSALSSSDSIDFILAMGEPLLVGTPSDGTVNADKLATNAVTNAKVASGISASKLTGAMPALDGSALTGAGGMQLLLDSAIGNVANFDVSSTYINSTYDSYIVHIHAQPNGDNKYLQMQVFVGGVIQTGNIYGHEGQYAASGAGFGANAGGNWGFQAYGSGNSAGYGTTAHIQVSNVNSTDFGCAMTAMCNYAEHTGGAHQGGLSCGHIIPANRANVVNGFRFNFHSGTIQTGHIKVYGLRT